MVTLSNVVSEIFEVKLKTLDANISRTACPIPFIFCTHVKVKNLYKEPEASGRISSRFWDIWYWKFNFFENTNFTFFNITQKNRVQFSLKSLKKQFESTTIDLQKLNEIVRAVFELFTPKNDPCFSLFREKIKN